MDFTSDKRYGLTFQLFAKKLDVPLKLVHFPDERHVRKIWERNAVLIRPDDHVCWRVGVAGITSSLDVESVLMTVLGRKTNASKRPDDTKMLNAARRDGLTATVGNVNLDEVEKVHLTTKSPACIVLLFPSWR